MTKPPNTTATGGYLSPAPKVPPLASVPPNLSFLDFLQSVVVGISGIPGNLVRPDWQPNPPKRPMLDVNWIAMGIEGIQPDFNAYQGYLPFTDPDPFLQRNETVPLVMNFYGPLSYENYGLTRDGFQLTQNLAQLNKAKVPFAYDTPAQHVPELINEEWFDRWRAVFYFRRQIQRTYPLLTFVSAGGTIYANTPGTDTIVKPFETEE